MTVMIVSAMVLGSAIVDVAGAYGVVNDDMILTLASAVQPTVAPADYPYASADPNGTDPLGYDNRQCTSFAAWWLSKHGVSFGGNADAAIIGPREFVSFGAAGGWDLSAAEAGYQVGTFPVIGAIAQWQGDEASVFTVAGNGVLAGDAGHVAVVTAVNHDGTAQLAEYNGSVPLGYSEDPSRNAPRYLYIGVTPPASGLITDTYTLSPLNPVPSPDIGPTTTIIPPVPAMPDPTLPPKAAPSPALAVQPPPSSVWLMLRPADSTGRDYQPPVGNHWHLGQHVIVHFSDLLAQKTRAARGTFIRHDGKLVLKLPRGLHAVRAGRP